MLCKVITYEQAVRFLADFIAGDVYYSTNPTRGETHNLVRARSQLALLRSMEENFDSMQMIVRLAMNENL
jgi:hypothetical protein